MVFFKQIMIRIPRYTRYIFFVFSMLFALSTIFRVVFFVLNRIYQVSTSEELLQAFWFGIRFDLKLAALCTLPLAIFISFTGNRVFEKKWIKLMTSIYATLLFLFITTFYVFDFGYYDYLEIRLDASSLRFFNDLSISSQMLWESYPVLWIFWFIVLFTFLGFWIHKKGVSKLQPKKTSDNKPKNWVFKTITLLLLGFFIYNSFSHYPLRWSQAFFTQKNKVNQFALNPVLFFFDSFSFRSEGFDIKELQKYYPVIADHLQLPKDKIRFERTSAFPDSIPNRLNVVFVMMESVGVKGLSYYGNPLSTSPNIDNVIAKGIRFSNFFTDKGGTAASVFASLTGLPDIDDVSTASRNPMIVNQRILMNQFEGFEKLYFLGGSANWANIRGIFHSNIKDLKIFEEGSYEIENRSDVWGIDDYALFREADKELKKLHDSKKPFVAYIQTASNHRPYTYPDQLESFRALSEQDFDEKAFKNSGFKSIEQLNALRYLDFNVGRFLNRAKKSGYYENTIFVFFGDHNSIMDASNHYEIEYNLNLTFKHIPFVIYAPQLFEPRAVNRYGMLIDLFPTVMNLVEINHTNYTLGRDLLDSVNYKSTSSFVYLKQSGEPTIGILKDSLFYKIQLLTKKAFLFDLKDEKQQDLKNVKKETKAYLDSLTMGYYYATKYLYFNNKKD